MSTHWFTKFTDQPYVSCFVIVPRTCHACNTRMYLTKMIRQLQSQSMGRAGLGHSHYHYFCESCIDTEKTC